jgi:hypothetical protein
MDERTDNVVGVEVADLTPCEVDLLRIAAEARAIQEQWREQDEAEYGDR